MRELLLLCRFASHLCCLLALASVMLLTTPVAAQDTPGEQETERDRPVRIGVYFSRPGLIDNIDLSGLYGGGNIESSEDDVMPYPGSFLSIKYNKYQATLGWGDDNYGKENKHNENIARFTARYNYYPAEKIIYMFGGFNIWYFNKKFSFTKNVCVGDLILEAEYFFCEGESKIARIETDRPDGKSVVPGINLGIGVEYKFLGIVWSHEAEFYRSACKYKDFICGGTDFKFLGLHFEL